METWAGWYILSLLIKVSYQLQLIDNISKLAAICLVEKLNLSSAYMQPTFALHTFLTYPPNLPSIMRSGAPRFLQIGST